MMATGSGNGAVTRKFAASERAAVLVEALPYIQRFWGRTVVVKYGGNVLAEAVPAETKLDEFDAELDSFAQDIVLLQSVGFLPVVVHGGGPQIDSWLSRIGKKPEFVDGLRVTDLETLEVVKMVLLGKLNPSIVQAINRHGGRAVGVSGLDSSLIVATKSSERLGFVGEIVAINPDLLVRMLAEGLIPVVATIGADTAGQGYNINADFGAAEIARALDAEKLVYLTNIDGVRRDPSDPESLIQKMTETELAELFEAGSITGGMAPKLRSAGAAVAGGVNSVHILDGRIEHSILLEMLTDEGIGTMIVSEKRGGEDG